jgi:hypothetical protein
MLFNNVKVGMEVCGSCANTIVGRTLEVFRREEIERSCVDKSNWLIGS